MLSSIPSWAKAPIDADSQWGRGAQLSLVNPAHIPSTYGQVNFNYDLIIPKLSMI